MPLAVVNSSTKASSLTVYTSLFKIVPNWNAVMEIKTLRDKECELLQEVLAKTDWNLENASRLLRIPLSQVKKKIREHNLPKPENS
jgi:transcriptional regulator with GAF, ATPase, and Fis domain